MIKPKFKGNRLSTGKDVIGHLFFTNDERYLISPTGSEVFGFKGDEDDKHVVMANWYEVSPESVIQIDGVDKNKEEPFPYSHEDYLNAKTLGLELDNWQDYQKFYNLGVGYR